MINTANLNFVLLLVSTVPTLLPSQLVSVETWFVRWFMKAKTGFIRVRTKYGPSKPCFDFLWVLAITPLPCTNGKFYIMLYKALADLREYVQYETGPLLLHKLRREIVGIPLMQLPSVFVVEAALRASG
jgi:hypothetical protein